VQFNFVEHKLDEHLSQKNLNRKKKMEKEKRGGDGREGGRERERENNPLTGMNLSLYGSHISGSIPFNIPWNL
jgi:hypothetical protein